MICGRLRLPLIIICSALSGIVSGSIATESNLDALAQEQSAEIIRGQGDWQSSQTINSLSSEIHEGTVFARYQTVSQLPTENSDKSVTVESSVKINKHLFIIAMAATSIVSMFLLWILFKKPASSSATIDDLPALGKSEIETKNDLEAAEKPEIVSVPDNLIQENSQSEDIAHKGLLDGTTDQQPIVEKLSPSGSLIRINERQDYIDVVFELTQDLHSDDRNVRRKAMWELAKLGDSRVIKPLMAIMPQANSVDKSLIVKAVTQITNRSFKSVNAKLFAMLNDDNPQVRVNAILDLAAFYKFVMPVTQQLCKMQLDSDPQVRQTASRALEKLNLNYPVPMTPVTAKNQLSDLGCGRKKQAN